VYFISKEHLNRLLEWVSGEYRVFVPVRTGDFVHFKPYLAGVDAGIDFGAPRTVEPAKAFYFRPRQRVVHDFDREIPAQPSKPICLAGMKACDLRGFEVLDGMFVNGTPEEPLYAKAREDGLIIASDCIETLETCFCTAVGERPHPIQEFDLNLSAVTEGYVAVTASEKGEHLVTEHENWFSPAPEYAIIEREAQRQRVESAVRKNVAAAGIPEGADLVQAFWDGDHADLWRTLAGDCVECGACNMVCPTCHCFLLHDTPENGGSARQRTWDACLLKDYARCAGGSNPRSKLWMRLRNRFEMKFDFFPKTAGLIGCTGCGRCISACPARIDIRAVLRKLVDYGRRDQSIPAPPGPGN